MADLDKNINSKQDEICYEVFEGTYDKYTKLNSNIDSALALEIKNGSAKYYYVNENGKTKCDFAIYLDNNWITLDKSKWKNKKLVCKIIETIKSNFDFITVILPIEDEDLIKIVDDNYDVADSEIIYQGKFPYKKLKINIK